MGTIGDQTTPSLSQCGVFDMNPPHRLKELALRLNHPYFPADRTRESVEAHELLHHWIGDKTSSILKQIGYGFDPFNDPNFAYSHGNQILIQVFGGWCKYPTTDSGLPMNYLGAGTFDTYWVKKPFACSLLGNLPFGSNADASIIGRGMSAMGYDYAEMGWYPAIVATEAVDRANNTITIGAAFRPTDMMQPDEYLNDPNMYFHVGYHMRFKRLHGLWYIDSITTARYVGVEIADIFGSHYSRLRLRASGVATPFVDMRENKLSPLGEAFCIHKVSDYESLKDKGIEYDMPDFLFD